MGFLSPWFLAGLAAVGLPVWLHLLRQFKRTPRPFSSLMFFERRIQSSTKHRRLRYLTLLAMRVALLALLALLFANPFIYRKSSAASRRTLTVLALDRSFSMRTRGRMESAKAEARQILNAVTGTSRVQVLAFDSHVEALTEPQTTKSAIDAAITSIQPNDQASSYGELSRALRVMEQTSGMRLDVHVITDAQQSSMPSSFADLQVGPHTNEAIHAIGQQVPNWAVQSVSVPARIFGSENAKVSARIASWNGGAAVKRVSLLLDGHPIASKEVNVPSCGGSTVEFDDVAIPYGVHRGEVRVDGQDDLPDDDSFPFSIERADPRKVLFLFSSGRSSEIFYYKAALQASAAAGLTVEGASIEQIGMQQLSRYAYVVLHDPAELDNDITRSLTGYVEKGGAVLIAAGPRTAAAGKIPITGNELVPSGVLQGVGQMDEKSPALAGVGQLQNVEFLRTPRISLRENDRVLAHFADGSPLLFERRVGEGRALVFASTLDNSSNDFPLHTSFLPFVVQTGAYLSGAAETPSSVVAGTPVLLRRTREQNAAADVVGPDGKHELALSDATRAMTFDLSQEGFYEVQSASGERMLMAVHADRRESDLTQIPQDTLALWRSAGKNTASAPTATAEETRVPWSPWRYILTLVLIAATIESVFAGRYLSAKGADAPRPTVKELQER